MKPIKLIEYQKDYYKEIITCLSHSSGAILALDTGMGKTYLATKMIQDEIKANPCIKILVLVRKKNIYDPWENLFKETLIADNGLPFYFTYSRKEACNLKSNKDSIADFSDYNVILSNYDILIPNIDDFRFIDWDLIIYDEIHDRDSKVKEQEVMKTLSNLNVKKQLALTASPLKNTIKELYYLYNFTLDNKNIYQCYEKITLLEKVFISKTKDEIKKSLNLSHLKDKDYRLLASFYFEKMLATKIKPYIGNGIFYHSKKEPSVPCLPFLINRNIHLPIHFKQSIFSFWEISEGNPLLLQNDAIIIETSPAAAQCSNKINLKDPCLGISTKEVFTLQLVKYIVEKTTDKIVVFSQFTRTLSYFLRRLSKYGCVYIDGKTSDYMAQIENFRTNTKKRVILVSLEAFKEGIDLRCANHCIFLDLPYNPQVLIQAKDRCHRTGQKKNVFAYYLFYNSYVKNSPDNIRKRILNRKQKLFDELFGYDKKGNRLPEYLVEDYVFNYDSYDDHFSDIQNNYTNLKTMLSDFFIKEDFTYQYQQYDSVMIESEYIDSGVRVDYQKLNSNDIHSPINQSKLIS